jgi:hypothetical protein
MPQPVAPASRRRRGFDDGKILDARGVRHDLFGERKPHGEIPQVGWGRHHDRMRQPVVGEGDGGLFGELACRAAAGAGRAFTGLEGNGLDRPGRRGHEHE